VLSQRLLGRRLRHHSRGTEQRARVTHHCGLRHSHGRNVCQSCVWSDATAGGEARSANHPILWEYLRDQKSRTGAQFGLQATGKANTEHPGQLIMLLQPEDGLGSTLWSHAALQQYHLLMLHDPLPQQTGHACGLLLDT
jgi:hypothetical protein